MTNSTNARSGFWTAVGAVAPLAVAMTLMGVTAAPAVGVAAVAGLDPRAVAIAHQAGCQAWLNAHPTSGSSQASRMRLCVADQQAIIDVLTPSPSATPSQTPSASPTVTATATPGPTGTTAPPTPSPSTTLSGPFPGPSDTGVPAGTVLAAHGSTTITVAGTVVDGWDVAGYLQINAANVTVRNSRVRCTADTCITVAGGINGLRLSRVDIGPDSGYNGGAFGVVFGCTGPASSCVLDGLNIHNISDGLRPDGGFTLTNSYIHNLDMTGDGAHSDGIQTFGGDHALIRHNTIEGGNTSDLIVQGGHSSDWVVDGNLLLGRKAETGQITSWAVGFDRLSCPNGGCLFTNNVLNRTWEVGPSYTPTIYTAANWYGNTWQDTGATVPVP